MGTDKELAIVFADVVGSTELYESLGDDEARETVGRCVECMKECTIELRGEVIKTMGDEVMSTFDSADDAMLAASEMQQRIQLTGAPHFYNEEQKTEENIAALAAGDERDLVGEPR